MLRMSFYLILGAKIRALASIMKIFNFFPKLKKFKSKKNIFYSKSSENICNKYSGSDPFLRGGQWGSQVKIAEIFFDKSIHFEHWFTNGSILLLLSDFWTIYVQWISPNPGNIPLSNMHVSFRLRLHLIEDYHAVSYTQYNIWFLYSCFYFPQKPYDVTAHLIV